ncbi:MAG: hypothetical protein RBS57_07410 [Desulforhabdus sp.]|jgi:hypothetical protein|nr:hypothetical protein [Desulforhabdus sp.]
MEPNVIKELQTLEAMVLNWKSSYMNMRTPEGGDEFLADDFQEEITTHVSHFVRRLYENSHISLSEAHEFLDACYSHVVELRTALIEGTGG